MTPNEQEPEDRPWTEEQWQRFMEKSDARSAKFGELLETFIDHPDRDEIIAREMGWERDEADDDEEEDEFDSAEWASPESDSDDDWEEIRRQEEEALEAIPAYSRGYEFGLKVHDVLKPYFTPDQEDQDEDLIEAVRGGFTIAAKIAGAHGMGYEDDVLCGNIVCCKRSLAATNECLRGLQSLHVRSAVPAKVLDPLIQECKEVRALVEEHIEQLRSRVWWQ